MGDLSPLKSKIQARPSAKSTRWRSLPGTGVIRDLATSRRFWISAFAEMTDRTRWLTNRLSCSVPYTDSTHWLTPRPGSSVAPTDIDRGRANATGRLTPLLHSEVRGQLRKSQLTGSVSDRGLVHSSDHARYNGPVEETSVRLWCCMPLGRVILCQTGLFSCLVDPSERGHGSGLGRVRGSEQWLP